MREKGEEGGCKTYAFQGGSCPSELAEEQTRKVRFFSDPMDGRRGEVEKLWKRKGRKETAAAMGVRRERRRSNGSSHGCCFRCHRKGKKDFVSAREQDSDKEGLWVSR
ncbi:hypothetical protein ACLOJK_016189 [Asimina triloba]